MSYTFRQVADYVIPDEFVEVVLEMAGYAISYWAFSLDEFPADDPKDDRIVVREYDSDTETVETTKARIAEAFFLVATRQVEVANYIAQYAEDAIREDDAGEIDSDLGDVVLQVALFGEIVYG